VEVGDVEESDADCAADVGSSAALLSTSWLAPVAGP
jgi:hypothetical protein